MICTMENAIMIEILVIFLIILLLLLLILYIVLNKLFLNNRKNL